jgi:pimeloyl-ACP methyl ester carboxylesterase/tetratricopeptide (TPR) repeat protein
LEEGFRRLKLRLASSDIPHPEVARGAMTTAPTEASVAIGRDAELATLEDLLASALDGRRQVVFVTGEPGIGKTTLVGALLDGLQGRERLRIARGYCVDHRGAGEPYMPVLEAVGRLSREAGDSVLRVLRDRAPSWLVQLPWLVPDDELEDLRTRAFNTSRERMLREMVEALDIIASEAPLVLLIEDLHWSDPSTLDLIESLARREEPSRLLVLCTRRRTDFGAEADAARKLVQDLRVRDLATEIPLSGLGESAIRLYLEHRFSGALFPDEVAARVLGRTGGNPLFVLKHADAWVERSVVLKRENGTWELCASTEELFAGVPGTLITLIERQIEGLNTADATLLEVASVAGVEFPTALVGAAAEIGDDEAEAQLTHLARAGLFVAPSGEEVWPDGTISSTFRFMHDICQEVLYDRLPAGRRARLHERIGSRLETGYGEHVDRVSNTLSWHFVQANEADRAVRHLLAANERALQRAAPREALTHLEAALNVLQSIVDERERARQEIAVRVRFGTPLILLEGWDSPRIEAELVRAADLAQRVGEPQELAAVLIGLASLHEVRGNYRRSEELTEKALALPTELSSRELVESHELLACSLVHQGDFRRALEHADQAVAHFDGVYPDSIVLFGGLVVSSHIWASLALWHLGLPDTALARAGQAVAASELAHRAYGRAMALVETSFVHQFRQDPDEALRWAEAGVREADETGFDYWRGAGAIIRGWALAARGDAEAGLEEVRKGLEITRTTGARLDDAYFLGVHGDTCRLAACFTEGLEAVDHALELLPEDRPFFFVPELHRLRGELFNGQGLVGDALEELELAMLTARDRQSPMLELRAAVSLGRLRLAEEGDAGAVAERVAEIASGLAEGHGTPDLVSARRLLDDVGISMRAASRRTAAPAPGSAAPVPRSASSRVEPVRYARSGELNIAYQVTGEGATDIVLVPGFISHLQKDWDDPRHAHFLDRLGTLGRLIRFDKRGTGLSDRPGGLPDLETRMDDVRAVMDSAGSERAVLFGYSEGGPMSILFAATYPDRVSALVVYGSYARRMRADDYPWAAKEEDRLAYADEIEREWGWEADLRNTCPNADEAMARWWGDRARAAASPGAARDLILMNTYIDVRDVLSAVHVPTLVLHRRHDPDAQFEGGRYMAEHIAGATFVELPGTDHFVAMDPDQILDEVEEFLTGARPPQRSHRVLKTILISDLVGSTKRAAELGDSAWADLLARHNEVVRSELLRYDGEEVDTTGDGIVALFDGPARAIRCGLEIHERLDPLGLSLRVGIHTGEIERRGEDVRGIAVHQAARVCAEAGAGEVFVSATTRDLVEGSGLIFEDRGERVLKGIPEPRRLFAARG